MPVRSLPAYSTGTIAVVNGSRTVTGAGTLWLTGGESPVAAGDMLIVGTGVPVMVDSVDSATQITLVNPWPNATAPAGTAYRIRRYVPSLTGTVLGLVQTLDAKGTDAAPPVSWTMDGGAIRWKWRQSAGGQAALAVGPSGAAAGSLIDALKVGDDGSLTLGSPAGGDKGPGTMNVAGGLYVDGVAVGSGSGSGTVTSVASGTGLTGGPITGSGALSIATHGVTNTLLAQMPANRIKGNASGATATAADLTPSEVAAMLPAMMGDSGAGGQKGLVPAPAAGDAAKFLRGDGTYATPAASSGSIASTDITDATAAGRAVLTAADAGAQRASLGLGALAVKTTAALTDLSPLSAPAKLLGSSAAGAAVAELTLGTGLALSGSTLSATSTASGTVTSVATSGGITGGTITGSGTISIDTNNSVGIGSYAFARNISGGIVANGSTLAGSSLYTLTTSMRQWQVYNATDGIYSGAVVAPVLADGGSLPGTWRNVSGVSIAASNSGMWIRTA